MKENVYLEVQNEVLSQPNIAKLMQKGHCREWSAEVLSYILKTNRERAIPMKAEAREVNIFGYSLSHTFIRLIAKGYDPYIMDGTGVESHPVYFGMEESAPKHLQNSSLDMISNLFAA